MTDIAHLFPFGRPITARKPSASGAKKLFLLGAYPSALHVKWTPHKPFEPIAALAVDNEPEPFWTGADELRRIDEWKAAVAWRPEWGTVEPVGSLNGSSGLWVDEKVLAPLGVARNEAWITDCLDTYRFSKGQEDAVAARFAPFAQASGLSWAGSGALRHPTEDEIVNEARKEHLSRLGGELIAAQPDLVVTLGNAALRVMSKLVVVEGKSAPETLAPGADYGSAVEIRVGGKAAKWLPLVHPGQRSKEWRAAHGKWIRALTVNAPAAERR